MVAKSEPEIKESRQMAASKIDETEDVSIRTLEVILDAKLDPLIDAIKRLERAQEKIVEILQKQAVQDIRIEHIEETVSAHITKDEAAHNDIFAKLRNTDSKRYERLWDFAKIIVAATIGAITVTLFGK